MTFAQPFHDYELLDRVGAGAMGTVFKARQARLGRIVAIKVLKPSLARDTRYVDRLKREARIVASLNHPNIVTGYDLGEEGGFHYFVMEFVEGRSLRQLLAEWGMFPEEKVLAVALQVAAALDHAYQRGVIHRDIKPGNILIDDAGTVKLTDMGLAKGPADLTLTRDGATIGTPQYISPEQARNPQDVDVRSDLWSLGATLYHMATGSPPFTGDTMAAVITKVLHEAPRSPRELNPALSPGLSLVIRKLLAKDLRVRYQTPRELLDDLARLQAQQPPQVDEHRLSASERGSRPSPWLRAAVAALACAVVGVAVWAGMQLRDDRGEAPAADVFLARLDADLAGLATPGERYRRVRVAQAEQPPGTAVALQVREQQARLELAEAVDAVAAHLLGPAFADLVALISDPAQWCDAEECDRRLLQPALQRQAGWVGDLPAGLPGGTLARLRDRLAQRIRARDAELLAQFEQHVSTELSVLCEQRLRNGDFVGAERLWSDALATWCNGVQRPRLGALSEASLAAMRDRVGVAATTARSNIDAAEQRCVGGLRREAMECLQLLGERLDHGSDPDAVAASLVRLREQLQQCWPPSSSFRVAVDPWIEIDRDFRVLQQRVGFAVAAAADRRRELFLDLAWLAVCVGEPADGMEVLRHLGPAAAATPLVQRHREAIAAAAAVQVAVLQALLRVGRPLSVFLRQAPATVLALRATEGERGMQLSAQPPDGPVRRARLTEFHFSTLLAQLEQAGTDPLRAVPEPERSLGAAVLGMVGDDLGMVESPARLGSDSFLLEHVWPRILRQRRAVGESPQDRVAAWSNLLAVFERGRRTGELRDLQAAMLAFRSQFPDATMAPAERQELDAMAAWMRHELRRRDLLAELTAMAPKGAAVRTAIEGDLLEASVVVPAAAMSAAGWQARGERLECAGGPLPWNEVTRQRLELRSGFPASTPELVASLDLVLPSASAGSRLYALEFRGLAVLLALRGDDGVFASVVDGDLMQEGPAQRAFLRAFDAALDKPRIHAVPGAVHRLRLALARSPGRGRASLRVLFEDVELCSGQRDIDPERAPLLVLYAQQELALVRVAISGRGL